jgi:hypothetical protein
MKNTQLLWPCPKCDTVGQVAQIFVKPDTSLCITAHCDKCKTSYIRNYDLTEIIFSQVAA